MKRLILFVSLFAPVNIFANPILCPVCVFAVAGGLGIAEFFGVRDEVVGVWIGAALLAFSQWTIYFLEKKNIKKLWVDILCYLCWYSTLIPLYMGKKPKLIFNYHKILGIDSFLLSVAAGTLAAIAGAKLYEFLKSKNGGKAHFPYERVVIPVVLITVVSCLFHFGYKI
ncbi:MAG: hypothetical protein LBI01_02225 [Elusimicrobium sp.]|jgi:hypothetical protein|nr:hypothetical protein [Elusimicrobium sp.]